MQQHIAEQLDSMTTFMLLQHEAAVANLLEVSCTTEALHTVKTWIHMDHFGQWILPVKNLEALCCYAAVGFTPCSM